jgi:hypothetical protein
VALTGSPGGIGGGSPLERTDDADATRRCVGLRDDCESNSEDRVGEAPRFGIVSAGARVGDIRPLLAVAEGPACRVRVGDGDKPRWFGGVGDIKWRAG